MPRLTSRRRQEIVDQYCAANNGWVDPHHFAQWVRDQGPDFDAYSAFTFDVEEAARKRWADEARAFVSGLKIRFTIETIEGSSARFVTREAPLFVSPLDKRANGGGYYRNDPGDPEHLAELCRQAARDVGWLTRRYALPLASIGADMEALEDLRCKLAAAGESEHSDAA